LPDAYRHLPARAPRISTEEFNMKMIMSAAAFAAATLAAPTIAQEAPGGHHATQSSEAPGPNMSDMKDMKDMKACDCCTMKSGPAEGMKKMSGDHMSHPGK
jgi:hypothetical protein